jgi:hypothetical protein
MREREKEAVQFVWNTNPKFWKRYNNVGMHKHYRKRKRRGKLNQPMAQ